MFLFSPFGTPIMQMLLFLMKSSLNISSFSTILFVLLLFILSAFYYPVFQITGLFFCILYC